MAWRYCKAINMIRKLIFILAGFVAAFVAMAPSPGAAAAPEISDEIIVGTHRNFPPFYMVDGSGKPYGFAIDVFEAVARRAGLKVTYHIFDNGQELQAALLSGSIQAVANLAISKARQKSFLFTQPTNTQRVVLFVRAATFGVKSLGDFSGKPIAAVNKSGSFRMLTSRGHFPIKIYNVAPLALFDLLSGRVEAVAYPEGVLWKLAQDAGVEDRVKTLETPLAEVKRGIAVSKDNAALHSRLDDALGSYLNSPEFRASYRKWFGKKAPFWTKARMAMAMITSLVIILILMIWWRYHSVVSLNKELRETIDKHKQTEDALNDKSALLETTLDNVAQGFCVYNADKKLVAFNQEYIEMGGFPPDFIHIGIDQRKVIRFLAEHGNYGKGDIDELVEQRIAILTRPEGLSFERHRPNKKHYLVSRKIMPDGGFVGTYTDITGRKLAEEQFRKVFNHITTGSIAINDAGIIELYNSAAEDIFGYAPDEAIGKNVSMLMPEPECGNHDGYIRRYLNTGVAKIIGSGREVIGIRKNGEEFPMHLGVGGMTFGSKKLFIGSITDITDRKQSEQNLLSAKEQAEFANRSKSEFLSNMSHELRTPLNAVIGFSEMMMTESLGPIGNDKYVGYAGDINASGQHLLSLISDILDLSKVEAGKVELNEEEFDPVEVINSCLVMVKGQARSQGLELETEIPDQMSKLWGDKRMLKQILINLLSNAVKFTPEGGRITFKAWSQPGSGHVFQVIDTGIGVALDDIPKILRPFSQIENSFSRKYQGTGLGLSLVKNLIELQGGYLDFQSELGVGSTVTVRFPKERIVAREVEDTSSLAAI